MDVKHCNDPNKDGKKKKGGGGSAKKDPNTDQNSFDPCKPQICDPRDPKHQKKECPEPYLCLDKLRFPDPTEKNAPCDTTPFLGAKNCADPRNKKTKQDAKSGKKAPPSAKPKIKKPHPCDKKLLCSSQAYKDLKMQEVCDSPALCYERIKNPDDERNMKKAEDCIP